MNGGYFPNFWSYRLYDIKIECLDALIRNTLIFFIFGNTQIFYVCLEQTYR